MDIDAIYTSAKFKLYPTPESTPPAALLAHSIQRIGPDQGPEPQPLSETTMWQAAFIAGTLAGTVGTLKKKTVDKATIQRRLKRRLPLYRSELPEVPKSHRDLRDHVIGELFRQAERDHLKSHVEIRS